MASASSNTLRKNSKVLSEGDPKLLEFPMKVEYMSETIRIMSYGRNNPQKDTKTIIVIGATGTGKSTLLHGMINHIFGVNWSDDYRFKLLPDFGEQKVQHNQAKGQTQSITIYKLGCTEEMCVPYNLVLIDTPGFGDERGVEHDVHIAKLIEELFFTEEYEVNSLSAVGFVVKSSSVRFTTSERYIFDCIQSLFGRDIADNIFMLITFVDNIDRKPKVLASLKEGKVVYQGYFRFNNSALLEQNVHSSEEEEEEENDDLSCNEEDAENPSIDGLRRQIRKCSFEQIMWDLGMQSFKKFFKKVESLEERQLVLTKEVLELRNRLEVDVSGIQNNIREGIGKLEELEDTQFMIIKYQKEIDLNKHFKYTIKHSTLGKVDLPPGKYATVCTRCKHTCHYPCGVPNKQNFKCWAMGDDYDPKRPQNVRAILDQMNRRGLSVRSNNDLLSILNKTKEKAKCRICPQKCPWLAHERCTYKYEMIQESITKSSEDLKKKYKIAIKAQDKANNLLQKVKHDFEMIQLEVMKNICNLKHALDRLKEIALKPNPLSQIDYLDKLISSEEQDHKPGWNERVKYLRQVRDRIELLTNILNDNQDPFGTYIDDISRKMNHQLTKCNFDQEFRARLHDICEDIKTSQN